MTISKEELKITQVLGENGLVSNDGVTRDTDLVVSGTATSNASLNLYDQLQYIGFVRSQEMGDWAKLLEGISTGFHSLTVAVSSEDPVMSEAYRFTIATTAVRPEIIRSQDSSGRPIEEGGFTQDTFVTLFGTSEDSMVEILDNSISWGTAQVDGDSWSKQLAGLDVGRHQFTARNMSDEAESLPWSFTVLSVEIYPEISRVVDSQGKDIADGGSTEDTNVTLYGTAEPNSRVEVLDETVSWGTAQVSINGTWTKPLAGLAIGTHRFKARSVSSQLESRVWVFTVAVDDPLVIDTSPMRLDGFSIYMGWARTENDSPGNTQIRRPTGGREPYSYSSSDPAIAQVDSEGKVQGIGWGDAIISVTDQKFRVVSFSVTVTNVYVLLHTATPRTHVQAVEMFESLGSEYKAYEQRAHDEMVRLYQKPFPFMDQHYWCPVSSGCGSGLALSFVYPEQELGCADPDLQYEVLLLIESGKQKGANFVFFK
ncbi:hypothetical protein [Pseudomonas quasicaspiana]|uniref:hypothetical protein n=1 Tax=Pseudomonas quasicaspiana TaxID=2829821 RepID=UPI001E3CF4AF|nr:hypothetical protein [Pseudomonas quasicaspiana]MCD5970230.1 hypothetical protein [Pseudomonas quasicaspiana]